MKQERSNRPDAEASLRHAPLGRPVARLAIMAAVVAAVLGAVDAGLFYWSHVMRHAETTVPAPRAAPREPAPGAAETRARAPDYRWVDRAAGVAEIPVERAMRVLAVDDGGAQQPRSDTEQQPSTSAPNDPPSPRSAWNGRTGTATSSPLRPAAR